MDGGKNSETIQIEIKEARNIKGSKGENVTTYVKLEFDGKVIGETPKVESGSDKSPFYNYTCYLDCWTKLDEYGPVHITIEDLASKPLILTFIEVLPKEKKQREEKVVLLGQCSVDFVPFVKNGEVQINRCLIIHPIASNEVKASVTAAPVADRNVSCVKTTDHDIVEELKPEIDITMSLGQPLLDEEMQKQTNLLTIRMGSAYSLPDAFTSPVAGHNYMIGLSLPQSGGKDSYVLFQNGTYKPAAEKEQKKRMLKWHNLTTSASGAQFIPCTFYQKPVTDEEKGDFTGKSHEDFRNECENEKARITWDTEKRSYFDAESRATFRCLIQNKRIWPVEVVRVSGGGKPSGTSSKRDKLQVDDDGHGQASHHGVCYVDLGPLLYPGVSTVSGAFKVHPFCESEFEKMTSRRTQIVEEVGRVQNSTVRGGTNLSPSHRVKGQSGKRLSVIKNPDTGSVSEYEVSTLGISADSAVYADSKTYVYIEFSLARPLIPQRQLDELITMVSQTIPPRPAVRIQVGGAERAVKDYHSQLTSVAHMILDEFRTLYGNDIIKGELDLGAEEQIKRKKNLYYELNTSGKYFAYKEQLKHSIVKIVREKFMKTSVFATLEDLQQFLSELYVYLIDEMHVCIGRFLSINEKNPDITSPEITSSQLKQFAEEAFDKGNFEQASHYYKERILKNERDPTCWLELGVFHLSVGNNIKAKECFKESVALDQAFVEGLLLYGIVSTLEARFDEAEVMFERSITLLSRTTLPPFLPWVVFAIFYEFVDNPFRQEHAIIEANRVAARIEALQTQTNEETKLGGEDSSKKEQEEQNKLEMGPKAGTKSNSNLSVPHKQKGTNSVSTKPTISITNGKQSNNESSNPLPTENQNSVNEDKSSTEKEKCVIEDESGQDESIYLQVADWLIERHALNFAEAVLARELLSCTDGPSSKYFILLARLHMKQKNYQKANEAINKAIALDIENPNSWAVSGHLAYHTGDMITMKDCYERTISFVNDARKMHTILLRLAGVYMQESKFSKARRIYLMASKYAFTCPTWLGVGMACYRMDQLDEAEDALSEANVLDNTNPIVWGYLALVTLKTDRQLEAEQCYKYASKLGLDDKCLLDEISDLQNKLGFGNPSFQT